MAGTCSGCCCTSSAAMSAIMARVALPGPTKQLFKDGGQAVSAMRSLPSATASGSGRAAVRVWERRVRGGSCIGAARGCSWRVHCTPNDQETTVWRHGRKFASVEDADEWEDMFRANKELQALVDMEKASQVASVARKAEETVQRTLQLNKSDFTISSIVCSMSLDTLFGLQHLKFLDFCSARKYSGR